MDLLIDLELVQRNMLCWRQFMDLIIATMFILLGWVVTTNEDEIFAFGLTRGYYFCPTG
jgi:hypothetical protein